jgi:hypothetical protein
VIARPPKLVAGRVPEPPAGYAKLSISHKKGNHPLIIVGRNFRARVAYFDVFERTTFELLPSEMACVRLDQEICAAASPGPTNAPEEVK